MLKSAFDALEREIPGHIAASHARNDALIGFHSGKAVEPAASFEEYVAELNRRYDLVVAKLEEIQRREFIPTGMIMGWMYGDLYRLLDGSAQQYVMLNTPPEFEKFRQQLRRTLIQLSNLETEAP